MAFWRQAGCGGSPPATLTSDVLTSALRGRALGCGREWAAVTCVPIWILSATHPLTFSEQELARKGNDPHPSPTRFSPSANIY